jgi:hypothetical protein
MKLTELSRYYIKELNPELRLENIKGGICYKGTWKSGTSKDGKQWFNGEFVRISKAPIKHNTLIDDKRSNDEKETNN